VNHGDAAPLTADGIIPASFLSRGARLLSQKKSVPIPDNPSSVARTSSSCRLFGTASASKTFLWGNSSVSTPTRLTISPPSTTFPFDFGGHGASKQPPLIRRRAVPSSGRGRRRDYGLRGRHPALSSDKGGRRDGSRRRRRHGRPFGRGCSPSSDRGGWGFFSLHSLWACGVLSSPSRLTGVAPSSFTTPLRIPSMGVLWPRHPPSFPTKAIRSFMTHAPTSRRIVARWACRPRRSSTSIASRTTF
jgi:hypothetical protein